MKLLEPTTKFVEYVFLSSHYLNCPKHILNHTLDCIYRQFHDNHELAIKHITDILKKYEFSQPKTMAEIFVKERNQIKYSDFIKLNVNNYINITPEHIKKRDNFLNDWYKRNTKEEWRYGNLVSRNEPSFNFKEL